MLAKFVFVMQGRHYQKNLNMAVLCTVWYCRAERVRNNT